MPAARALSSEYPETVIHKDPTAVLHSRRGRQVFQRQRSRHEYDSPSGLALRKFTLTTLIAHWLHKPNPANVAQPEVEFGKDDAHWWRLPVFDSALVSTADGSGKNIYTRDRAKYRRMLRESVRLHAELQRRWPELQKQYRDALPGLVSPESWEQIFEEQA
jgi:galactofuranosylgalactofuranosylrhamnosyl-N-acetylglucosaminyl-diphospho-decaprenol beta-1,5/1,6-galactofuranosyltransferase